jgi:hypothetical protein
MGHDETAPVPTAQARGPSMGPLVVLEVALFAAVFVAGGVLAWLAAFGEGGTETTMGQGPPVAVPPVPAPSLPGGGASAPAGNPALVPLAQCLEAAGFAVEDNSEVHPETLGSLRVTRGPELLFVFLFATAEEATAFQEGYGPGATLVTNLGKVIVEYTSPPPPETSGPVEGCSEPFA